MELVQFKKDKDLYEVTFNPLLLTIEKFKKIITRDKSKDKDIALKEIAYIYHFADIRSDYMYKTNLEERSAEIIRDLHLPKGWKVDKDLQAAIDLYKERTTTVNSALYESACLAAFEISEYLKDTKNLLWERTDKGAAVTNINTITGALSKVPSIMRDLTAAHTELIKEQKLTEGRSKGSKEFNTFEDGLKFDE